MGVLKLAGALLGAATRLAPAACYEPQLASCAVRCSSNADCAPGQTCGAQGYCAVPELACPPGSDAAPADGPPADTQRPDAAPKLQLRVRIPDGGRVTVDGVGLCDSDGWPDGDCRFAVTAGVALTARAIPHAGYTFDQWTSTVCAMAGQTCVFTPTAPATEIRVRFERVDDDDDTHLGGP